MTTGGTYKAISGRVYGSEQVLHFDGPTSSPIDLRGVCDEIRAASEAQAAIAKSAQELQDQYRDRLVDIAHLLGRLLSREPRIEVYPAALPKIEVLNSTPVVNVSVPPTVVNVSLEPAAIMRVVEMARWLAACFVLTLVTVLGLAGAFVYLTFYG